MMKLKPLIMYIGIWSAYIALSYTMFPKWNLSVAIPIFGLTALGAWLYGTRGGLYATMFCIIYHMILLSFIYPEHFELYQTKFTSISLLLAISFLTGNLRHKFDGIRELNRELDAMVLERDQELTHLTDELLENAERRRMALGQELHDGIGQQLTGIKLLCSSLENQLEIEKKQDAKLALNLSSKATNIHNDIRLIARALFPVRIAHVGLYAALNEMISCYSELHKKPMSVKEGSELRGMPESLALQLYRICQECCTFLLEHSKTEKIDIILQSNSTKYVIAIEHDDQNMEQQGSDSIFNLIQYRIRTIKGNIRFATSLISNQSVIYFEVPKTTH